MLFCTAPWRGPRERPWFSARFFNNLQPAMLRGEESNGMLLAATSGPDVVFLTPEKECVPGAKVS